MGGHMRTTKRKKQGQNVKAMQTAIDRRISIRLQMFLNRVAAYNQQQARMQELRLAMQYVETVAYFDGLK